LENSLWSFLGLPRQSDEQLSAPYQLFSTRSDVEGADSRREAIFAD
jgi:hypothetical protein